VCRDFDSLFAGLASDIQREQDGEPAEGSEECGFGFDTKDGYSISRGSFKDFKEEKKGGAPMTS